MLFLLVLSHISFVACTNTLHPLHKLYLVYIFCCVDTNDDFCMSTSSILLHSPLPLSLPPIHLKQQKHHNIDLDMDFVRYNSECSTPES